MRHAARTEPSYRVWVNDGAPASTSAIQACRRAVCCWHSSASFRSSASVGNRMDGSGNPSALRVTWRAIQYGRPDRFRLRPGVLPRQGIEVFLPVLGDSDDVMLIDPVVVVQPRLDLRPVSSTPKYLDRREAVQLSLSDGGPESVPPK